MQARSTVKRSAAKPSASVGTPSSNKYRGASVASSSSSSSIKPGRSPTIAERLYFAHVSPPPAQQPAAVATVQQQAREKSRGSSVSSTARKSYPQPSAPSPEDIAAGEAARGRAGTAAPGTARRGPGLLAAVTPASAALSASSGYSTYPSTADSDATTATRGSTATPYTPSGATPQYLQFTPSSTSSTPSAAAAAANAGHSVLRPSRGYDDGVVAFQRDSGSSSSGQSASSSSIKPPGTAARGRASSRGAHGAGAKTRDGSQAPRSRSVSIRNKSRNKSVSGTSSRLAAAARRRSMSAVLLTQSPAFYCGISALTAAAVFIALTYIRSESDTFVESSMIRYLQVRRGEVECSGSGGGGGGAGAGGTQLPGTALDVPLGELVTAVCNEPSGVAPPGSACEAALQRIAAQAGAAAAGGESSVVALGTVAGTYRAAPGTAIPTWWCSVRDGVWHVVTGTAMGLWHLLLTYPVPTVAGALLLVLLAVLGLRLRQQRQEQRLITTMLTEALVAFSAKPAVWLPFVGVRETVLSNLFPYDRHGAAALHAQEALWPRVEAALQGDERLLKSDGQLANNVLPGAAWMVPLAPSTPGVARTPRTPAAIPSSR